MEKEKLKSMPKVELHCHLDGSLSRSFISQELGREVDPTELQVAYGCRSLKEYLEKFDLPVQCLQSEKSMRKAGYDFIRSVAAENMKYVEVRFAPLFSAHEGFSTEQVIEALLNGLEDGRKDFGTESNIIVCAMRHQSEEDNLAMFRAARNFGRGRLLRRSGRRRGGLADEEFCLSLRGGETTGPAFCDPCRGVRQCGKHRRPWSAGPEGSATASR